MREKLARFMQGRYGVDKLSQCILWIGVAFEVLRVITRMRIFGGFFWLAVIICYYRIFSKDIPKRYAENQRFTAWLSKVTWRANHEKDIMKQRKTHHIYKCPSCKQKIRIPRGKGKIAITCPKCKTEFIKRS